MHWFARALAFGFGAGRLPRAPGTWGSLLALPLFLLCAPWPYHVQGAAWFALFCAGWWAAELCGRESGLEDDPRIVIDEICGQWLALLPLAPLFAGGLPAAGGAPVLFLAAGFLLFRWLDIAKPAPINAAERHFRGGFGVMADDALAGAMAAAALLAARWFWLNFANGGAA